MLESVQHYFYPENIQESVDLLGKWHDAALVGGGTYLIKKKKPAVLIDTSRLGLKYINETEDQIDIGAGVTMEELASSPLIKNLAGGVMHEALTACRTKLIRNMATIGGCLAMAVPSTDLYPALYVLEAVVNITGPYEQQMPNVFDEIVNIATRQERCVPVSEFFQGNCQTALKKTEIITGISIKKPSHAVKGAFIKISRTEMDIALVNAAVLVDYDGVCKKIKIAQGAVAPTCLQLSQTEFSLCGKVITEELIQQAAELSAEEIKPITDVRATSDYRRQISKVAIVRAIRKALERAGAKL